MTNLKWLPGSSMIEEGIPYVQQEVMNPYDFYAEINRELEEHFNKTKEIQGLFTPDNMEEEEIRAIILQRLCIGWYNEIAIRDFCQLALEVAPFSLKAQQALLRQVNDEHNHATWIWTLLQKRGIDPRDYGTIEEYRYVWAYRTGLIRKPEHFFTAFASTQLVTERIVAGKSIPEMTALCKDIDPEVAHLYGEKILNDEIFHVERLPEYMITKHAVTLEDQNRVRLGIKRGFIGVDLVAKGIRQSRNNYKVRIG